ncbi:MAG: hypothetical protein ACR2RB_17845 [Gammaproteobacteria bacterium]
MKKLDQYPLQELKLLYRALHSLLSAQPDLMDAELLHDMQAYLQKQAARDGVDVSIHAQWATWLNNGADLHTV